MKKIITTIVVLGFSATIGLLSGCNTVNGIGKDVSSGGREIQKAAT